MKAKVFIKYGKQEHLQQIVDGSIRFAPSQKYVLMEKELHNKGQGDLLDGKMKIKAENVRLHHPETNELLWVLPKCEFVVSIQDVNNMPVFCLSEYDESDVIAEEGGKFINVHKDKIDGIKHDFKDATHALIIFEPEKFIDDVIKNVDEAVRIMVFRNGVKTVYAKINADIKKTAILKLNPCPLNKSVSILAISFGIDEDIVSFTASIGMFKLFVITPTKAIVGIIDITRKKAS